MYDRPTSKQNSTGARPEDLPVIVDALGEWVARRKQKIPAPCPENPIDCAKWWRDRMQEAEQPGETRQVRVGDDGIRWSQGYAVRLRDTLLKFLDLTPEWRNFIVAARSEGIFWRGEEMEHMARVYEETMAMRRGDAGEYRRQAIADAKAKLGIQIGGEI